MRSWDVRSVPARPKRKAKSNARCWSSHPAALTTKVWLNACSWLQPCSGLSTGFLLRGLQVRVLLGSPKAFFIHVFNSLRGRCLTFMKRLDSRRQKHACNLPCQFPNFQLDKLRVRIRCRRC